MSSEIRTGRPPKQRDAVAGERLRLILEFLGKSWGRNRDADNHVLRWSRWERCGLPRSVNTLRDDMQRGIPLDRLSNYAECFGMNVSLLTDSSLTVDDPTFVTALHRAKRSVIREGEPPFLLFGPEVQERYLYYNSPDYLQELHALLGGPHIVHYASEQMPGAILICTLLIEGVGEHRLYGRSRFVFQGVEIQVVVSVFRWHNNVHAFYHSDDYLEFGHHIMVDPVRHQIVRLRDPLFVHTHGITDDGMAENRPVHFRGRIESWPLQEGESPEQGWERANEHMRKQPIILENDQEYKAMMAGLRQDDILGR
jgi:hypothetical protein